MLIYSDKIGKYQLIDYEKSHSLLLLRKYRFLDESVNIDIVFKAVFSLNIQIVFKGLSIFVEKREKEFTITNPAKRQYIIKLVDSEGVASYLDCGSIGVFENSYEYSKSCLSENLENDTNKLIFWLTDLDFIKYI